MNEVSQVANASTTPTAVVINPADIQRLYIAFFNRPADPSGLDFWTDAATKAGSLTVVQDAFSASAEFKAIYSGMDTLTTINAVYQNLFGRDAEPGGLLFWAKAYSNGLSLATITYNIALGAQGTDLEAVNAKIAASTIFTANIDTTTEIVGYSGDAANILARAWLSSVINTATQEAATVQSVLNETIANVIQANKTYTVTSGASSYNEGLTGEFSLVTKNVANGTVLNYTLSGVGLTADDVTGGLSGTVTVMNGKATISVPLISDRATEGAEILTVKLSTVGTATVPAVQVASTSFTINDSSANSAPVFLGSGTTASATVRENVTTVMTATATDADSDAITYALTGTDGAEFAVDAATGAVTFVTAPNFESRSSYSFIVTATDTKGASASQTVTVTVTDVNEAPAFAATTGTATVAENSTAAISSTGTATDPDANDTFTYSISGTDSGKFTVNSSTGAINFTSAANFEAKGSAAGTNNYSVTLVATDKAGLSGSRALTISVTDANEAPTFAASTASLSIAENSTAAATVTGATDVDASDVLTYTLSGADSNLFSVSSTTGAISFKTAANYEAPGSAASSNAYSVNLVVTDKAGLTASQAVTINVTDVNDVAPVISSTSTFSVAENTTTVGTVTSTDVDTTKDAAVYSISAGADSGLFNIDSATGALTFKSAPNFEAPGSAASSNAYSVTVMASDGKQSSTQAVTVNVTDVNDVAPVITSTATYSVKENATAVGTVTSTDVDTTKDAAVYTISAGADSSLFSIDSSTGALSFKSAPNYEAPGSAASSNAYSVTVMASDGKQSSTQAVTVNVADVNDVAPVITSTATFSVAENSTTVGSIVATDVDTTGEARVYSITAGDDSALFSINSSTGALTFKSAPDFEAKGSKAASNAYSLTVTASDGTNTSTAQSVTVNVTDVTGITGVADSATTKDNTAVSIDVLNGTGADTYADTTGVTKSIASVTQGTSGTVTISSDNKAVYLPNPGFLNGTDTFTYIAKSSDGSMSSATTVTVTVTTENTAPVITAGQTFTLTENTTAITKTAGGKAYAAATDQEGGQIGNWTMTDPSGMFEIDSFTGLISVVAGKSFDFDSSTGGKTSYTVTLVAQDSQPLVSTAQTVVINVTDANDIAPVISSASTASFTEGSAITSAVYTVSATDADTLSQTMTYSIGGTDSALFSINSSTGAVTFKAAPNFESAADAGANNVYDITVTANDGTNNSTATAVAITVSDSNDEAPAFTGGTSAAISVGENSTTVSTVAATDADSTASFKVVTYSISGGADSAKFSINSTTGALTFVSAANFEAPGSAASTNAYSLTLTASDGTNSGTQAVTVTVTNVNEAPTTVADTATAFFGQTITISPLTNDTDVDAGDTRSLVSVVANSLSAGGSAVVSGDTVLYTPSSTNNSTAVTETFNYVVKDAAGLTSIGTVTVSVKANTGGTSGDDSLFGSGAADSIDGLAGNDTIFGNGGQDSMTGGDGNDRVTFSNAAAQIAGGNGVDTLVVNSDAVSFAFNMNVLVATPFNQNTGGPAYSGSSTTFVTGFENLDATTASNAITVAEVSAATTSIILSGGNDTVTQMTLSTGAVTVMGLGGNDSISTGTNSTGGTFSIDGGDGNDTISVSGNTGSTTLIGGAGNDSITGGGSTDSVSGGDGNDTITFAPGGFTSLDSVGGGSGTDTLVSLGGALADTVFTNTTSIETLNLTTATHAVTLGSLAAAAGLVSVIDTFAGAADSITVGAGFTNDLSVTMSAVNTGSSTLTASAYTKNLTVNLTAVASANTDTTITGGTGTNDKIVYADALDQSTGYNFFSGIETIAVASGSTGTFKFTTNASNVTGTNLLTIDSTNTSGVATINATATNAGAKLTILTGAGADLITGSAHATSGDSISSGAGNDTITFASGNLTSLDTVAGGSGTDQILSLGGALADAVFTSVTSVETLNLTTATHAVTLGSLAAAAGLVSVIDGYTGAADSLTIGAGFTNDLTVTMSPITAGSTTLTASAYTKNLTVSLTAAATGTDTTITGGTGTNDKIVYADDMDQSTGYDWFSAIETIAVASGSTGTFKFTTNASNVTGTNLLTIDSTNTSGVATINATATNAGAKLTILTGAAADLISGSAHATSGDSISSGAGNDTITFASGNLTSLDTVAGGSGTDQILSLGGALADAVFTSVTSVETLNLTTATHAVTLGSLAAAAGLVSVIDGYTAAADSLTIGAGFTNDLTVTMSPITAGSTTLTASAYTKNLTVSLTAAATGTDTTITGGTGTNDKIVYADALDQSTGYNFFSGIETIAVAASSTGTFKFTTSTNNVTGTNKLTIDSTNTTGVATIVASATTTGVLTILTGSANDLITASVSSTSGDSISSGAGDDTIAFSTVASLTSLDTIAGGSGTDILTFSGVTVEATTTLLDSAFTNVSGIETLNLWTNEDAGDNATNSFTQTITLDAKAQAAGIRTVNFSSGDNAVAPASADTNTFSLDASGYTTGITITTNHATATTNVINVQILGGTGNDTITAGAGDDAISITGGAGADTIAFGTAAVGTVIWNLGSHLASGTTSTNADKVTGFTQATDKIELLDGTLKSGAGGQIILSSAGDSLSVAGDVYSITDGNEAAELASLSSGADSNAYVLDINFTTELGTTDLATGGVLSQTAVNLAITTLQGLVTTSAVGTNIILSVRDDTATVLFKYTEAGTSGIQSAELTLIGFLDTTTALAHGDFT